MYKKSLKKEAINKNEGLDYNSVYTIWQLIKQEIDTVLENNNLPLNYRLLLVIDKSHIEVIVASNDRKVSNLLGLEREGK